MKLFELKDWQLTVDEAVYGLLPFKKILKRDKSRNKDTALKEMLFIYYHTDIKSDYLIISDSKTRTEEIKRDIGLPDEWKIDATMQEAIDFYESKTLSVIGKLYKNALKSANDISDYLTMTDVLLAERDDKGKPVNDIGKITTALTKVKGIMQDLKAAEKEVLKEQAEMDNRMKGSKTMSFWEEGLDFEN